jgi:alkanesulfonate monooxygenase SsuD/methylene tetrahydromethanopterin reductase-like flavin-dependent oxidoreductase (luciferase family)
MTGVRCGLGWQRWGPGPAVVAKNVKEIRELAQSEYGRDPQSIKFLALLCPHEDSLRMLRGEGFACF